MVVYGVALDLIVGVILGELDSEFPKARTRRGCLAERIRFRFGYRSQTRSVAGTALKMRFIASARTVKALQLQHRPNANANY